MHLAMIIDEQRLAQEYMMLNRLAVGLISDGIQVTRIVPAEVASEYIQLKEQRIALAGRLETDMKTFPWLRSTRTEKLATAMEKRPPDVIFAVGRNAWPIGLDLARHMNRPLMLDVWSPEQVRKIPTEKKGQVISAFVTSSKAMRHMLQSVVDPGLVSVVPFGVPIPQAGRKILTASDDLVTATVVGSGRDLAGYRSLLSGLHRVSRTIPQLQIFLELRGPHQQEIWHHAKKLKMLGQISTFPEAAPQRSLLTQCDILLLPERYGNINSLILESMACGMLVLSRRDPILEMLIHEDTALLIDRDSPDEWAHKLERALQEPEISRSIGQSAREHVIEHHTSSRQVLELANLLERVVTGGSYAFSKAVG